MGPRVRFAPSPSGYLHIGGARTALFNWLWARSQGGQFLLRVEDTDQERSSLDSVRAILDSMRWLGLDWDEGPEVGGDFGPYFQSERRALYREIAERLIASGKAYRCHCTKEDLDRARAELKERDPKAQFVYPGTCREREGDPSQPHVIRFRTPREGATVFQDKVFGTISTPNSEQQDFVLMRSDGFPLYNFSAVIDDHTMGITLVARGRDHIGNTPQQVMLYEALGWDVPDFAHLPMMLSPKGEKLSKRHAAVGVQDYRDRGYSPMGVLNYLARFGWSYGDQEIFSREELIKLFSWDRVNKSDGKFDERKFLDVNYEHLRSPALTDDDTYVRQLTPFFERRGLTAQEAIVRRALPSIRERARTFDEAAHAMDFYFREPPEMDPKAVSKVLDAKARLALEACIQHFQAEQRWEAEPLEVSFKSWLEASGRNMKDVAQPLRVAVTGRSATPPLFEVMSLLGKERSLQRVTAAMGHCAQG